MKKIKKYRLLKPRIDFVTGFECVEGTIFTEISNTSYYLSESGWHVSEDAIKNTDWFEEVKEDQIIKVNIDYTGREFYSEGEKFSYYSFTINKKLSQEEINKIKSVIETII